MDLEVIFCLLLLCIFVVPLAIDGLWAAIEPIVSYFRRKEGK